MLVTHSRKASPLRASAKINDLLETIDEAQLRNWVEAISVPRHFKMERAQNQRTARWLREAFASFGFHTEIQGRYANIVAAPDPLPKDVILVGAHYDSVPMCPGADDNGSAVAAMLGCAAACSRWRPALPVVFVAFNGEEDGLVGSSDFVESYLPGVDFKVRCAHILEMVGYASSLAGSQRVPPGLPVKVSDVGDFLGLLANRSANGITKTILRHAKTYLPALPVTGLDVKLGLEKFFPVLLRSDHAPFWTKNIPAVMWTDTSEFRNPNYHRASDTPATLNYPFLRRVTQLLTATVVAEASGTAENPRERRRPASP